MQADGGVNANHDRLEAFNAFSETEWADWLDRFLNGEPCAPRLLVGAREPHVVLAGLCDRLPGSGAGRLGRGAVRAFQGTAVRAANAGRLHALLHLLAYTLPPGGIDVMRQRLFERGLEGLSFAGQELDALALVVNGKYGVEPELREYVDQRVDEGASFDFHVAALRALSFRGDEGAAVFLQHLPPHLVARPARVRVVAATLHGVVDRTRFISLYRWYAREWDVVKQRSPQGARLLGDALLTVCAASENDYARMMRGELEAERRLPEWEVIESVMAVQASRGENEVVESMQRMYEKGSAHGVPWRIDAGGRATGSGSAVYKVAPARSKLYVGGRALQKQLSVEQELMLERSIPDDGPADWGWMGEVNRA
jgi:hypothetical protein